MGKRIPVESASRSPEPITELRFVFGKSPAMHALEAAVEHAAGTDNPVLILGESGTGKRALAFRIHQLSKRSNEPFRELNCADLTPQALPNSHSQGNGSLTSSGTLFLTDLADIGSEVQMRLLALYFDCSSRLAKLPRLIVSSGQNLEQAIRTGTLRQELYYAISSVSLRIPPLRYRKSDVPDLADFYLQTYADLFGRPKPVITPESMALLVQFDWPGNVHELKTAMKMLVAVADERIALAALRAVALETKRAKVGRSTSSLKQVSREASRQAERVMISDVLSSTGWNRKKAAKELQISYKALLYKLKQIQLEDPTTPGMEPL